MPRSHSPGSLYSAKSSLGVVPEQGIRQQDPTVRPTVAGLSWKSSQQRGWKEVSVRGLSQENKILSMSNELGSPCNLHSGAWSLEGWSPSLSPASQFLPFPHVTILILPRLKAGHHCTQGDVLGDPPGPHLCPPPTSLDPSLSRGPPQSPFSFSLQLTRSTRP